MGSTGCVLVVLTLWASVGLAGAQPVSTPPRARGPQTLRIYLARHGETTANVERRVVGQLDSALTDRGVAQAALLRERLRGIPLDGVYASPLSRSTLTAGIAGGGRPVRTLRALMERHQGRFQGQLADADPGFAQRMTLPGDDLDGGETMFQLAERARAALRSIRQLQPQGTVLVVGHFLTNQMLLKELLGISVERAMTITQGNDELYLVEVTVGRPVRLWKLVRTSELGAL